MYCTLENVHCELDSREELKTEVENWWGALPPITFSALQKIAFFPRQVATCRYEDLLFWLMARKAGLKPLWMEYLQDKVHFSGLKGSLFEMILYGGNGEKKRFKPLGHRAGHYMGEKLGDVPGLVSFHHGLRGRFGMPEPVELSSWVGNGRRRAAEYYPRLLSLGIAHGVVFDNFHGGESGERLNAFVAEVVQPAYDSVRERFGVTPLIVQIPWWPELAFYPADTNWREHGVIPPEFLVLGEEPQVLNPQFLNPLLPH